MAKKNTEVIRLFNCSRQLLKLQVRPPGGDFYLHEQQVSLRPGQTVLLPKDHLIQDQVSNLQSRGMLKVIFDSEMT